MQRSLAGIALGGLATQAQVLVAKAGQVVAEELGGGAEPETRFLLFSISKTITALAVLRLVDHGRLELDAPLADVLPDFASGGKAAVTVRQVLSHTGGFPGNLTAADFSTWERARTRIMATPQQPELAGVAVYHGLSFAVLGALCEEVARTDFPTVCAAEVLVPLGMTHTTWGRPRGASAAGLVGDAAAAWATIAGEGTMNPAAGAWSTARDLWSLFSMLREGGVHEGSPFLSAGLVREMRREHAVVPGAGWAMGLGLFLDTREGTVFARGTRCSPGTFGHSGFTATQAWHDPGRDLTLIALTNSALADEDASRARFGVLADEVHTRFGA